MTTILLAHASSQILPLYPSSTYPFVAPGTGMSSRYVTLAASLRRANGGVILPALLSRLGTSPTRPLIAGCYSAGYALLRELTRVAEDRSMVNGWLFIDGGHAAEDPDGTAADVEIGWLVGLVRDAAEGRTSLCYGYSDVNPGTYASTMETIDEAVRLAGVAVTEHTEPCPGCLSGQMSVRSIGNLWIEWHNHHASAHDEHIAALRDWGGALAHRCLAMVGAPSLSPLDVALSELAAGVCESPPGSNTAPRIREYFAGCERDGRPVGITAGSWCAAFAAWCDKQAGLPTTQRAAVWELVEDARAAGTWREVGYKPQRGDLAIFCRGTGDPRRRGEEGHVGRVEAIDGDKYTNIDGNHGDRVARVERRLGDEVGWVTYSSTLAYDVLVEALAKGAAAVGLDATARAFEP